MSDLPSRGAGPKAWPLLVPVKQDQYERGLPGAGRVRPRVLATEAGTPASLQVAAARCPLRFLYSFHFSNKETKAELQDFFFLPQITKLTYSSRNPETNTVLGKRAAL